MEGLEIQDNNNLLAEIRAELMRQSAHDRERLLYQKMSFFGVAVIALALLAAVVLLAPPIRTVLSQVNGIAATLKESDLAGTVADVQKLAKDSSAAFASVGETASSLDGIDIETLNSAIAKLDAAADQFAAFDVETLNTAISNLNASVEPLAKFFGVFKKS